MALNMTTHNDLDAVCFELSSGVAAYHNATTILRYYNHYGYTEHFRELIGEENLIDQAKEVISKFVSWLKKKVGELITLIKSIFQRIWHHVESICREFGTDTLLRDEDRTIRLTIPYDIGSIAKQIISMMDKVFPIRIDLTEPMDEFQKFLNQMYVTTHRSVQPSIPQSYTKRDVRIYAYNLSSIIGQLKSRADTLTKELDRFRNTVTTHMTTEEILHRLEQLLCGCNSGRTQIAAIRYIDVDVQESSFKIQQIVQRLSCIPSFITNICSVCLEHLQELSKIYNSAEQPIELKIPFDTGMLRRLSTFFGGSLEVRHLVVTNVDPKTWPLAGIRTLLPTYGWCYAGSNRSGAVDLWVNIRLLLSKPLFKTREEEFLKTIVHECCHLYDAQHGLPFETVHPYQDYQTYRNSSSEDRAFAAEKHYPYTDADRAWVRAIFKQVEQLYHQ